MLAAAAKHLTPVTLELGGKSPTIVEPGTDLAAAARVIAHGRFSNAGQTCVAPDYLLAIDFIAERDKPLAMYAFTASAETKQRLQAETSSGALVFGAALVHLAAPELPFGGVGESGMGRYHGKYSIDAFSHLKAVLDKS